MIANFLKKRYGIARIVSKKWWRRRARNVDRRLNMQGIDKLLIRRKGGLLQTTSHKDADLDLQLLVSTLLVFTIFEALGISSDVGHHALS